MKKLVILSLTVILVFSAFMMSGLTFITKTTASAATSDNMYRVDIKFVKKADVEDAAFSALVSHVAYNGLENNLVIKEKSNGALTFSTHNVQRIDCTGEDEHYAIFTAFDVSQSYVNYFSIGHEWKNIYTELYLTTNLTFDVPVSETENLRIGNNVDIFVRLTSYVKVDIKFKSAPGEDTWDMFQHLYMADVNKEYFWVPSSYYEYFNTQHLRSKTTRELIYSPYMYKSFLDAYGITGEWQNVSVPFFVDGDYWNKYTTVEARIYSVDPPAAVAPLTQDVTVRITSKDNKAAFDALSALLKAKKEVVVVGGVFGGINATKHVDEITDKEITFVFKLEETVIDAGEWQSEEITFINPVTLDTYNFAADCKLQDGTLNIWMLTFGIAGGVFVLLLVGGLVSKLFKKKSKRRR